MLTIAQLTQHAADSDGGSEMSGQVRSRCHAAAVAAALWAWNWREWPWSRQELAYTGTATYATGTAAVTNGSATVEFTGAAIPAFAAPAFLRIDSTGEELQVASRTDADTIVLSQAYAGTTASGLAFRLCFPTIELASNVETVERAACPGISFDLRPASWGEWQAWRWFADEGVGIPSRYIFQPADPLTAAAPRVILWPAPGAQQVRLATRSGLGALNLYESGTAAVSAGGTTVTGTSTAWQKMGFSGVGLALEFPRVMEQNWSVRENRQKVSAVGSDTSLTLASAWAGPSMSASSTANNYALSTILPFPDSFRDSLLLKVRSRKALDEGNMDLASMLSQAADQAMTRVAGRALGGDSLIRFSAPPWGPPPGQDAAYGYVLNPG